MTTGLAWNVDNPLKPTALFDPNAIRDIPCSWVDWLADIGDTYASHVVIVPAQLECVSSSQLAGVITARIKKAAAGGAVVGKTYGVTFRVTSTGGQVEDQTLYLKITEK